MEESLPQTDPSIMEGSMQPNTVVPEVRALASDPSQLTDHERRAAYKEARLISSQASLQNRVVVRDSAGQAFHGTEYPEAFTFAGTIRGNFDHVPDDPSERPVEMQISDGDFGAKYDHVIIETDDGEKYMIRRTSGDVKSAADQTFDLSSTTQERGRKGMPKTRRELDTSLLAEAVVVPGEQMVLGGTTDKPLRTRGRVTKITAFGTTEKHRVDPRLKILSEPERQSEAIAEFNETMKDRREAVVPEAGRLATLTEIEKPPLEGEAIDREHLELFEDKVHAIVQGLHEKAASQKRELSDQEKEYVKKLVQGVKNYRQEAVDLRTAKADEKILQAIDNNDIDVEHESADFEADVQRFVRSIHEKAQAEGRDLNEEEKNKIKLAHESVQNLRALRERTNR